MCRLSSKQPPILVWNLHLPSPLMLSQDLAEWSVIYIRYLQIFRRLEVAYDQVVHPQKRQDIRRALEACMGRMLEVRHWMVSSAPHHALPTLIVFSYTLCHSITVINHSASRRKYCMLANREA